MIVNDDKIISFDEYKNNRTMTTEEYLRWAADHPDVESFKRMTADDFRDWYYMWADFGEECGWDFLYNAIQLYAGRTDRMWAMDYMTKEVIE